MELNAYVAPLQKWWWLIVVSTLIAAGMSYFAVSQQPPIYQTRSTLLVGSAISNPNPTGAEFYLLERLALTYTDIAEREVVRSAVMNALDMAWLPEYTARTVPNTQLIELTVRDSNPERAVVVANELANQLILQSPTDDLEGDELERQTFIQEQLDDLEVKIRETSSLITTNQTELASVVSARQIADTQGQIAALENKLTVLQSNYASLLASTKAGAANSLRLVEPASIPSLPIGPEVVTTVVTAAAIGLTLAVAAAYLLEYLDDTVKTPADIERVAELPTLAGIAKYTTNSEDRYALITRTQPRAPVSEAFRSLRTGIMFANVDKPVRSLLVTSPNPVDGKSISAANLGVVMAQAGNRVLIIDADLRRPVQHKIFGLKNNATGLTSLLLAMIVQHDPRLMTEVVVDLTEGAIHETQQEGLFLLNSGPTPPNPAELVGSAKMAQLLEVLSALFDIVIVDSPPVLAVTDAIILSTRVDGVALLANSGSTRRNQLEQAVTQLKKVNANVIGIILNRLSARTGGYYYYGGSYYREDADTGDDSSAGRKSHQGRDRGAQERGWLPQLFARTSRAND